MRTEIKVAFVVGLAVVVGFIVWSAMDASREKKVDLLPTSLSAAEPPRRDSPTGPTPGGPAHDAPRRTQPTRGEIPAALAAGEPHVRALERDARVAPSTGPQPAAATGATPAPAPAIAEIKLPPLVGPPAPTAEGPDAATSSVSPGGDASHAREPSVGQGAALSDADPAPSATPSGAPAAPAEVLVPARRSTAASGERAVGDRAAVDAETRYTIASGDSLYRIARAHYGDARYVSKIREANPGIDPLRLAVGQTIILPARDAPAGAPAGPATDAKPAGAGPAAAAKPPDAPARSKPEATAGARHRVERGETLRSIARNVLNDEGRWRELFELNRDKLRNPDQLPSGVELMLPPASPAGPEHG